MQAVKLACCPELQVCTGCCTFSIPEKQHYCRASWVTVASISASQPPVGHAAERCSCGQVVCKPGTIKPYKRFEGEIYALKKEEGGRHTPFFTNYKPQFFFRTADITGAQHVHIESMLLLAGHCSKSWLHEFGAVELPANCSRCYPQASLIMLREAVRAPVTHSALQLSTEHLAACCKPGSGSSPTTQCCMQAL